MSHINVGPASLEQTSKGFKVHVGPLAFDATPQEGASLLMFAMASLGVEHMSTASAPSPRAASTKTSSKRTSSGRRARRSPEELERQMKSIVGYLKSRKSGAKVDELIKVMKLDRDELSAPIALGVQKRLIAKKGQKRATTYFATSASAASTKTTKKSGKKHAKKAAPKKHAKKASPKKSAPNAKHAKKASPKKSAAPKQAKSNGTTAHAAPAAPAESTPASS